MSCFKLNDAKMFSDIADGVAIVINSETGIYYGMNELGSVVFEAILAGSSLKNLGQRLKELPGAPADMQTHLEAFVSELQRFEILLPSSANPSEVTFPPNLTPSDFSLSVQEFSDAQELLLADPIHEVKPEAGWQPDKAVLEMDKELVAAKEAKVEK